MLDCGLSGPESGIFLRKRRRKLLKNDGMFTTCTRGGSCNALIVNGLFLDCTVIGAIDGEGGWGVPAICTGSRAFPGRSLSFSTIIVRRAGVIFGKRGNAIFQPGEAGEAGLRRPGADRLWKNSGFHELWTKTMPRGLKPRFILRQLRHD
jgi:hypothetical protein